MDKEVVQFQNGEKISLMLWIAADGVMNIVYDDGNDTGEWYAGLTWSGGAKQVRNECV